MLIIIGTITAAAAYLARQVWVKLKGTGSSGCGAGCGVCPLSEPDASATAVVPLESLTSSIDQLSARN